MSTFTHTTQGALNSTLGSHGMWGGKFTSPSDCGTITALSAWLGSQASDRTGILCLYADSAGIPGALLGKTASFTIPASAAAAAYTQSLLVPYVGAAATPYWFLLFNDGGSADGPLYYDNTGGAEYFIATTGVSSPPDPAPAGSASAHNVAIYATYTPVGSFTPGVRGYMVV